MSYEKYLSWAGEDHFSEWVDGEVIVFMPAKTVHHTLLGFLNRLLGLFVELFQLGSIQVAPFEMRLRKVRASREPDILFVAAANIQRLTPERLDGPADLVIEIVSDDSVQRDRRDKYLEYAEAGVKEYWIIDPRPQKHRADFYILNEPFGKAKYVGATGNFEWDMDYTNRMRDAQARLLKEYDEKKKTCFRGSMFSSSPVLPQA